MAFNLLDGYAFHIVCRLGIAANTPAMQIGELGFDTDTRCLRIGNDTAIPEYVMCSNSTVAFTYPSVPSVTFNKIELPAGGTVDGVDLSDLISAGSGLLTTDGAGSFGSAVLTSGDNSITITNPSGQPGNPDLRIAPGILSGFLATVTHTASFGGDGTAGNPLSLASATTTLTGGVQLATTAEAQAGTNTTDAITPATLKSALSTLAMSFTAAATAPVSPKSGDLWWDTSNELLSIYINAGGTTAWIDISS